MVLFNQKAEAFKDLFIYYVFNVLPACIPSGQKRAPNLITDGCEHMWLLGVELRTFGRAGKALNH